MAATRTERVVGIVSVVAAFVHGGLAPEHFEEWWGYGLFFLVAGAAQAILGLALALEAFEQPGMRRALYLAGAVGNGLLVATYVVSRTVGVPAGPEAGEAEPWDVLGILTTVAEAFVVAALVAFLRPARPSRGPERPRPPPDAPR